MDYLIVLGVGPITALYATIVARLSGTHSVKLRHGAAQRYDGGS
jgi:hypothetical protein